MVLAVAASPFTSTLSPYVQVQDDMGRGVPVGEMICSSETTEVVEKFLRVLQQGVSTSA